MNIKAYVAEFVGTAVLVLCGVGAALLAGKAIGPLGIGIAFGITLTALAFAIGPISGAHVNPAVTVGLALARRFPWSDVPAYAIAQIVGGIAGSALLLLVVNGYNGTSGPTLMEVANGYDFHSPANFNMLAAIVTEVAMTFVLVLTVLGSTATTRNAPAGFAGLPIGAALAAANFVAIPVTNASINPARSIGPALLSGGGWPLEQLWLFIVAPLVGGVLAALLWVALRYDNT